MKFILHTHACLPQSGLQKGFVTFSKTTDIYKRKQMQKRKIQRKVGIVRWREREKQTERERGGGGTGRNQQKAQARGLAKWSTRAWWIQLTAVTRAREVFDESLWLRLRVATRLLHLGTFQLAEVADHSLRPKNLQTSDFRLQRHIFKQDCRKSKPILVGLRSCRWKVWDITSRKGRERKKKQ